MSIKVEVFCDSGYSANTYLIYDNTKCIVVDPANSIKTLKKFIGNRQLMGVLLTHGHYDHFMELSNLLKEFNVKVYLHQNAYKKLMNDNLSCAILFGKTFKIDLDENHIVFVNESSKLDFDFVQVKVLYTPGHTNCSVVYQIDDLLFCGDLLFPMSVGRNDLPTGNVILLNESLKRIKKMEQNVIVHPGHDEIFLLKDALKFNPYLK